MTLMERTRTRLLLDQPFFGSLAMNLDIVEDSSVRVASVDGKTLRWNKQAWEPLSTADRKFVLAHEVMHCALLHPWRVGDRDRETWNQAADFVVNELLEQAGFDLLKDVLRDKQFDGMSAEQVYSKLMSQKKQDDGDSEDSGKEGENQAPGASQPGSGQSTPGKGEKTAPGQPESLPQGLPESPTGDFTPAPSDESGESLETQWQLAAEGILQVCKSAGVLPGGAEDAVKATREPRVDWVAETRDFVASTAPSEQTWSKGSRRFLAQDIYLPGRRRENVGRLVVGVDCSGSCWSITPKFTSELQGILREARPESVTLIYWDTQVRGVEEFEPDDFDITLQTKGGGGTMFGEVLKYIEDEGLEPAGLIVLTDLYIGDVSHLPEPEYPVLWAVPEFQTGDGPFGRTVRILEG